MLWRQTPSLLMSDEITVMSREKNYTDLNVWKESRKLVSMIYLLASRFPGEERYGLTSQIKRAVISIPSNIAEGIGRNSNKETRQFCFIAKGSLYEVETQVYLSFDLGFVKQEETKELFDQITTVRKMMIGFIKYLEK